MKRTFLRCQEYFKGFAFAGLLVMLFTVFSSNVQAQSDVSSLQNRILSNKHHASMVANSLGITVSTLGGWDVNKVITTLTDKLHSVNPDSQDPKQLFQYVYYTTTLQDVRDYNVAPEISLVQRLIDAKVKVKNGAPLTNAYLTQFYNALTVNF